MASTIRSGKASPRRRRSAFSPPHHDGFEIPRADLDAPGETLRIQHLEQSREAVGVPVVRGRGQEQAVLETLGQFTDSLCQLA
jgi:hypothetical protein